MKTGVFIPIRYSSERLPGKALMKINDKTIMEHLINRILRSKYIEKSNIIICTTNRPEDDAIVAEAKNIGVLSFRGSEDDIIDRFKCAADKFQLEYIIQVWGDDPLTEPTYIDLCYEKLTADSSLDIVSCEGLPLGMASDVYTATALNKVWEAHVTEKNDTGFIWYFTKTGLCNKGIVRPTSDNHTNNEVRLTLDNIEDFKFFEKVIKDLSEKKQHFGIDEILAYLKLNPEVAKINIHLTEENRARTEKKAQLEYKDKNGDIRKIII